MAVTVLAARVPPYDAAPFTGDVTRPPGQAGWNNPVGDPHWIPDYDWYRRIQLVCQASGTEDVRIVNWECYDGTLQFKTTTELTGVADPAYIGTNPTLYGSTVNNSTTWTVWASNGSVAANTVKYVDTKTPCISKLRANGQRVQVELGPRKALSTKGGVSTTWTIAAFLPGAGKIPTATATVVVVPPTPAGQPSGSPYSIPEGESVQEEPQVRVIEDEEETPGPEVLEVVPDSSWTKAEIAEWLQDQGVDADDSQPKKELLALVQDVVNAEEPSDD